MLNMYAVNGKIISDIYSSNKEDNEFCSFYLGVTKNYKKKDAQYPESLNILCKASGANAKFITQYFKKMDFIALNGELDYNEEYTAKVGTVKPGEIFVSIKGANFCGSKSDTSDSENGQTETHTASKLAPAQTSLNPLGGISGGGALKLKPLGNGFGNKPHIGGNR